MSEVKRVELDKQDIDDGNYEVLLDMIDREAEDVDPGSSSTITIELTITNSTDIEPETEEELEEETE